jgi:hypothetical protein
MAKGPGRPRGSRNKPRPAAGEPLKPIATVGMETYRAALAEPPGAVQQETPQSSDEKPSGTPAPAPAPTFDPAKFDGGSTTAVGSDEAKIEATITPEPSPAPRRGRPPGPRTQINVSGLEQLLLGVHTTLMHATKAPEWELGPEEARAIAEAYTEAAKHYPSLNIDPKHAAVVNLGTTLSIVYGSRIAAFRMRKNIERGARRGNIAQPVIIPQPAPEPASGMRAEQVNGAPVEQAAPVMTQEIRTGEIAGVGNIVFPSDHPLVSGRKQ